MTKTSNIYVCQKCGAKSKKWLGKCDDCTAWNSFLEETNTNALQRTNMEGSAERRIEILDLNYDERADPILKYDTGIEEFNRVLGGGCVLGSVILICGEPGIGKSTLLMQLCDSVDKRSMGCTYISGEESAIQVKLRAKRLGVVTTNVRLVIATNIEEIIHFIHKLQRNVPQIVIIDSIQTLHANDITSSPGTVSQVKYCAFELIKVAKQYGVILLIVGHVTKEGTVAGPKILEHMVDTVLYFEGDGTQQHRIIRTTKNRFGSTNEIGVFQMRSEGLIEVHNPSAIFMTNRSEDITGSCIFAGLEGTRSILVEVQALVVHSYIPVPRRAAIGWDYNRLAMIIAILNARLGLNLMDKEVYLNIAGGLKITEPAIDLAVFVALISASRNIKIPHNTVFFGEVGLSGELRQVIHAENRVNEASKLGFTHIVMPYNNNDQQYIQRDNDVHISHIRHISDLLKGLSKMQREEHNR